MADIKAIMVKQGFACFTTGVDNPNPIWNSENVLLENLPDLVNQLFLVVITTRFFYLIFRPFHQPHFVAEILAALFLNIKVNGQLLLPEMVGPKQVHAVETLAHVGLIYHVFINGLEMNLETVLRAGKKATTIAVAGTLIPMALGAGIYFLFQNFSVMHDQLSHFNGPEAYIMWTLVVSVTSFPILAHILADLKILYTGLGRVALTSATVNDFYNRAMFVLLVPLAVNGTKGFYSLMGTIVFILFCFFVLRPSLMRLLLLKTNQNEKDNYLLSYLIMGVFACATVTEFLGTNSVVGALVYGLILPRGRFTDMLIEKSDDIASRYLAPFFIFFIGLRANIQVIKHEDYLLMVVIILLLSCMKIVSTIIATRFYGMPLHDSMALGVLMNTKGALPFIILNIAWNKKILSHEAFTILVYSILVMTAIVSPIINGIYRPRKRHEQNKLRTIENLKADSEIRVMVCVHNARHANGMINILGACNGTNVSPLRVFALQLAELKGRATALLVSHIEQSTPQKCGTHELTNPSGSNSESITDIFVDYASNHEHTIVESLIAMSSYTTIHKDIYNLASEKQASLVLLPFHKQSSAEGTLEITDARFKDINQNLMQDAPCSVGIFVDRGHGDKTYLRTLMLFIGGPDDREALAIAWRMSKHPGTQLTVVRIILCGKATEGVDTSTKSEVQGLLSVIIDSGKEKELDEGFVGSFRLKAVNNEDSITYEEMEVHNGDDITEVLNQLDKGGYDLYILGQGKGRNSLLLENLLEWTDCPELGVIGDMLASNSFGSSSSILVVQQYGFGGMDFKTSCNKHSNDDDLESLFQRKK